MSVGANPDPASLNNEIASWCQSVNQVISGAISLRKRLEAIIATGTAAGSTFATCYPNQADQQQLQQIVGAMKDCGDIFQGGGPAAQTGQAVQVKDMDGSQGGAVRTVTLQNYAAILLAAAGYRG